MEELVLANLDSDYLRFGFHHFSQSKVSEKYIVHLINKKLNEPATRSQGVSILKTFLTQCSDESFGNSVVSWFQLCMQQTGCSNSTRVAEAYYVLKQLLEMTVHMPESKKQISSLISSSLTDILKNEFKDFQCTVAALSYMETLLSEYGASCRPSKVLIENFLLEFLTETHSPVVMAAARCFSFLPFANQGTHAHSWNMQLEKTCNTLHFILSTLYEDNFISEEINGNAANSIYTLPLDKKLEKSPAVRRTILIFCNMVAYLESMMRSSLPVVKEMSIVSVINVIVHALEMDCVAALQKRVPKFVAVATGIPYIHEAVYSLLERFIVCSSGSALPSYSVLIKKLIMNSLESLSRGKFGVGQHLGSVKAGVYEALTSWMKVSRLSSVVDSKLIGIILKDLGVNTVTQEENTGTVILESVDTAGKSKKRKYGTVPTNHENSSDHFDCYTDTSVCHAALITLQWILKSHTGINLDSFKAIQDFCISRIYDIQRSSLPSAYPKPFKSSNCRLELYRLLFTCLMEPHRSAPPPSHLNVNLLSEGKRDECLEVAGFCIEALNSVEKMIHPSRANFCHVLQSISETAHKPAEILDSSNQNHLLKINHVEKDKTMEKDIIDIGSDDDCIEVMAMEENEDIQNEKREINNTALMTVVDDNTVSDKNEYESSNASNIACVQGDLHMSDSSDSEIIDVDTIDDDDNDSAPNKDHPDAGNKSSTAENVDKTSHYSLFEDVCDDAETKECLGDSVKVSSKTDTVIVESEESSSQNLPTTKKQVARSDIEEHIDKSLMKRLADDDTNKRDSKKAKLTNNRETRDSASSEGEENTCGIQVNEDQESSNIDAAPEEIDMVTGVCIEALSSIEKMIHYPHVNIGHKLQSSSEIVVQKPAQILDYFDQNQLTKVSPTGKGCKGKPIEKEKDIIDIGSDDDCVEVMLMEENEENKNETIRCNNSDITSIVDDDSADIHIVSDENEHENVSNITCLQEDLHMSDSSDSEIIDVDTIDDDDDSAPNKDNSADKLSTAEDVNKSPGYALFEDLETNDMLTNFNESSTDGNTNELDSVELTNNKKTRNSTSSEDEEISCEIQVNEDQESSVIDAAPDETDKVAGFCIKVQISAENVKKPSHAIISHKLESTPKSAEVLNSSCLRQLSKISHNEKSVDRDIGLNDDENDDCIEIMVMEENKDNQSGKTGHNNTALMTVVDNSTDIHIISDKNKCESNNASNIGCEQLDLLMSDSSDSEIIDIDTIDDDDDDIALNKDNSNTNDKSSTPEDVNKSPCYALFEDPFDDTERNEYLSNNIQVYSDTNEPDSRKTKLSNDSKTSEESTSAVQVSSGLESSDVDVDSEEIDVVSLCSLINFE